MNTVHQKPLFDRNRFVRTPENEDFVPRQVEPRHPPSRPRLRRFLAWGWGATLCAGITTVAVDPNLLSASSAQAMLGAARQGAQSVITAASALIRPTIRVAGLSSIPESIINKSLPLHEPIWYWHLHATEIARNLENLPRVESATVAICSRATPGCFQIAIIERTTELVAEVRGRLWLLGADGTFVSPVTKEALQSTTGLPVSRHVVVRGIDFGTTSPQIVKVRLDHVRKALAIIEDESHLHPRTVALTPAGELTVTFRDYGFFATFELSDKNPDHLRHQAARLRALVKDLGARTSGVASIDLAFDKSAVVRLVGR